MPKGISEGGLPYTPSRVCCADPVLCGKGALFLNGKHKIIPPKEELNAMEI